MSKISAGWSRGVACRPCMCPAHDLAALDAIVREIVRDQPYDAVVQPVAGRRKKLLIADMDSTMITVECIDELADFVGKKGRSRRHHSSVP